MKILSNIHIKKAMKRKTKKKRTLEQSLIAIIVSLIMTLIYWEAETEEQPSAPPTGGNPATLYSNMTGDHLQQTFVTAIKRAQKSIVLMIYSLTDQDIIHALKEKSEAGVSVLVIYDAKASVGVDRKLGSKVNAIARASTGLMHQKILVLDEVEVWLGSANMTTDSLMEQGNLVAALRCNHLANDILAKARCMSEEAFEKPLANRKFSIGGQDCELWFLPDNKNAVEKIKDVLHSAKKTIRVAMFTFSRYDFAKELVDAKKRGVDVEVYLDHQSSKGASAQIVAILKKADIPIYTNPGQSLLHYKFVYVDDATLVNGSANWTKAAFQQNDDFFMILHYLTEAQKNKMAELIQHLKGSMKIALFGKGKMGSLVAEVANEKGHHILSLQDADVAIDFSHSEAVLKNVMAASQAGKSIVIGTTGWEKDLSEVRAIVEQTRIGALYSPNFSIGVHLYLKSLQAAAAFIAKQGMYDVAGMEIHHNQKADSPSGTAKAICNVLLQNFTNKKEPQFETSHSAIAPDQLHFSSLRLGHNPGEHTVIFDSPFDSITLTHSAKSRKGFAMGAVLAAEWLQGKTGFYTIEDIL